MNRINTHEFLSTMEEVRESLIGNTLRLGQQIFNVFASKYDIAEQQRGTENDCFHSNNNIILFFEKTLDEEALKVFKLSSLYNNLKSKQK